MLFARSRGPVCQFKATFQRSREASCVSRAARVSNLYLQTCRSQTPVSDEVNNSCFDNHCYISSAFRGESFNGDVELILTYWPPFCILWKRLSMLPLSLILLSRLAIQFYENSYGFSGLLITHSPYVLFSKQPNQRSAIKKAKRFIVTSQSKTSVFQKVIQKWMLIYIKQNLQAPFLD